MRWFSNVFCSLAVLLTAGAMELQEPSLSDEHMDILKALSPEAKPAAQAPVQAAKPPGAKATAPLEEPALEKKATGAVASSSKGLSDTQADLLKSLGASTGASASSAEVSRVARARDDEAEMAKDVAELKSGEAQRMAHEETVRKAAEEETRIKQLQEKARRQEQESARLALQEAKRKAEEEAKKKAAVEVARKAAEQAKLRAEEEAKRQAEEASRKALVEAKAKAALEAKQKAEAEEVKRKQEEIARQATLEAKRKAEIEAKREQAEKDRLMEIARVRLLKEQKMKEEREARAKRAASARAAAADRAEARAAEYATQARIAAEKLKNQEMKRKVAEEEDRMQKADEEKERREAATMRIQQLKEADQAKKDEKQSAQASVQAAFQAAIERSKEDTRRQKEEKEQEAKKKAVQAERAAAAREQKSDARRQAILKRRKQHKQQAEQASADHIHWGGKSKEEMERRAKLEAIKKELEEDSAYARAHARREEMREAALKRAQHAKERKASQDVEKDNAEKLQAVKEKEKQDAIEAERLRRQKEDEELQRKRQDADAATAAASTTTAEKVDDPTADSPMYDNIMVKNHTLQAPLGNWGKEQGVVHFMFLIEDDIPHEGVWHHFFQGAEDPNSYKIWVHCSGDPDNCKDGFAGLPQATQVESVPSYYCHDLVTAMVQLMRSATTSTSSAKDKFVFVSESTMPVKPFKTVQATLLAEEDSDLCLFPQNHWGKTHVDAHGFPEATALRGHSGATAYLIKHHQWVILNRVHSEDMVKKWQAVDSKGHWSVGMHGRTHDVSVNAFTRSKEANYCTDEWAFFATLFGAVTVEENNGDTVNIPGLAGGPLSVKGANTEDVQGRCHTFAFFESAGPYFNKLAGEIAQGESSVSCYPHCWQHPMAISQISQQGLSAIRESPFLFARKFPSDFKVTPEFYKTVLS